MIKINDRYFLFIISFSLLSLASSARSFAEDDGMIGFEEMQKRKLQKIQEFERQASPRYFKEASPSSTPAMLQDEKKQKPHNFHFSANPEIQIELSPKAKDEDTDRTNEPRKAEAKALNQAKEIKSAYPKDGANSGYFHQLSRALPCFQEFISLLYQARYARDSKLTACVSESKDCESEIVQANEKETETITERFYACLKYDPKMKMASKK